MLFYTILETNIFVFYKLIHRIVNINYFILILRIFFIIHWTKLH